VKTPLAGPSPTSPMKRRLPTPLFPTGSSVPHGMKAIQAYIETRLDSQDPILRTTKLMNQYANLYSHIRKEQLKKEERIAYIIELDAKMRDFDLTLPPAWQYLTTLLDQKSDRVFDHHFHSFSNTKVRQARSMFWVLGILLNESLIEYYSASPAGDEYFEMLDIANSYTEYLVRETCACTPSTMDCDGAAQRRLAVLNTSKPLTLGETCHSHTPSQQQDCYTMIFPLFIAGRSKIIPNVMPWIIEQLHHMSCHFNLRDAEMVAQILEQESNVSPWDVYAILGSYAFAS
jgi:hypothetical protein